MTENKGKTKSKKYLANFVNFFERETIVQVKRAFSEVDNILKILIFLIPAFSTILLIPFHEKFPDIILLVFAFGNLLMLGVWIFNWGKPTYELKIEPVTESYSSYYKYLKPDLEGKELTEVVTNKEDRVNKLVEYLKKCITWYAATLVAVYLLFIIEGFIKIYSPEEVYDAAHPWFKIFQDVFNFLSAMCLYLGFKHLYNKTLDDSDDNNLKPGYFRDAAWITAVFLLVYISCTIYLFASRPVNSLPRDKIEIIYNASAKYKNTSNKMAGNKISDIRQEIANSFPAANGNANFNFNGNSAVNSIEKITVIANTYQKDVNQQARDDISKAISDYEQDFRTILPNLLGLFIGCTNALTMFLLFGRYISMEHLINNTKEGEPYSFITVGTIYLLPIYALVQPLFGSFEISAFGNSTAFAACVFFICLCGKFFFLLFTWRYMSKRLMHCYLHSVVTYHGISPKLSNCFQGNYPTFDKKKVLIKKDNEPVENNKEVDKIDSPA